MSKEDSHRLQVPQGHGQLQGGPPSGILLFNVMLREMGHSTQGKRELKQGGHWIEKSWSSNESNQVSEKTEGGL